jgi:hypothetical protein
LGGAHFLVTITKSGRGRYFLFWPLSLGRDEQGAGKKMWSRSPVNSEARREMEWKGDDGERAEEDKFFFS